MKLFVLFLFVLPIIVFGQTTYKVKAGDKSKMITYRSGESVFKDNLPDGHYISYRNNDTMNLDKEIFISNGKKNGLESRYSFDGYHKYLEINWLNGKKNGAQIGFGGNGNMTHCISYLVTFKNDIIDGPFFINNSGSCQKNYSGFYKNGIRDSIWTYYFMEDSNDSTAYWLYKKIKYTDGKPVLLSAWNKKGDQTVISGNGIIIDSGSYLTTTATYRNGLKNGPYIETKPNGDRSTIRIYKDNLLTSETIFVDLDFDTSSYAKYGLGLGYYYPARSYLGSISEWSYPFPAKVNKVHTWIDTYIGDVFYDEINYENTAVQNGHWVAYFPNGIKFYEGDYNNGKKSGIWILNYPSGSPRIVIDYLKNTGQHFDSSGTLFSHLSNEYLSKLSGSVWYFNERQFGSAKIVLNAYPNAPIPLSAYSFLFNYDGKLKIYDGTFNQGYIKTSYKLLADVLTINFPDFKTGKTNTVNYKIKLVNENKIILKRIK